MAITTWKPNTSKVIKLVKRHNLLCYICYGLIGTTIIILSFSMADFEASGEESKIPIWWTEFWQTNHTTT